MINSIKTLEEIYDNHHKPRNVCLWNVSSGTTCWVCKVLNVHFFLFVLICVHLPDIWICRHSPEKSLGGR